jgi:23S rRNA (guanosine2251-2'-O)-methyltransferase
LKTITLSGLHTVGELIGSGRVKILEVIVKDGPRSEKVTEVLDEASRKGIPLRVASPEQIDSITGEAPRQNLAIRLKEWPYLHEKDLDAVLKKGEGSSPTFLLILDHIQDVGNFGAIIRSAHLCGVTGVIVPSARAAPVTSAVVRSSAGAAIHVDIIRVANLPSTIRKLRKYGVWVFGLEAGEGESILDADMTVPLALVLGGEEKGLSRLVRKECDLLVHIPMAGKVGSFNVSVASAVGMFEVMRQRMAGKP